MTMTAGFVTIRIDRQAFHKRFMSISRHETGDVEIDFARVMERQNQIRNNGSQGLESWLGGMNGVDLYKAFAAFEDAHTVRVGDELIHGDTIVINAGGRARSVDIDCINQVDWLNNIRLFDLSETIVIGCRDC